MSQLIKILSDILVELIKIRRVLETGKNYSPTSTTDPD